MADWFSEHYPERKARAFGLLTQARGGRENDPRFGHRFRGEGAYAAMIGQRVRLAGDPARLRLRADGAGPDCVPQAGGAADAALIRRLQVPRESFGAGSKARTPG